MNECSFPSCDGPDIPGSTCTQEDRLDSFSRIEPQRGPHLDPSSVTEKMRDVISEVSVEHITCRDASRIWEINQNKHLAPAHVPYLLCPIKKAATAVREQVLELFDWESPYELKLEDYLEILREESA